MGSVGIGCSVGAALGVLVPCSVGGDGFCCYGAVLVLNISANCSIAVVALGPYSKKGVSGTGLCIIVMTSRIESVALSCEDRDVIGTLIGNNCTVSEILSSPVDVM